MNESEESKSDQSSSSEESVQEDQRVVSDYFYVDDFSESQIREVLCIFKNDYKAPPKHLWVEKN